MAKTFSSKFKIDDKLSDGVDGAPDASIIIPAYNSEKTIQRAIQSVINQNYSGDIEIVVVDDGSTDETVRFVQELKIKNCRIVHQANSGASSARLKGVKEARSSRVMFLDADDMFLDDHIRLHMEALTSNKDALFAFGFCQPREEYLSIYPTVGQLILLKPSGADFVSIPDPLFSLLQDGCYPLSMNISTYKNNALKAMQGRGHVRAANDYDFCLRLSIQGEGVVIDRQTIRIERFEDGITGRNNGLQPAFACIVANEATKLSRRKEKKLQEALKHRIETSWPAGFMHCLWNGKFLMAMKVAFLGVIKGSSLAAYRNIYWTWDHLRRAP